MISITEIPISPFVEKEYSLGAVSLLFSEEGVFLYNESIQLQITSLTQMKDDTFSCETEDGVYRFSSEQEFHAVMLLITSYIAEVEEAQKQLAQDTNLADADTADTEDLYSEGDSEEDSEEEAGSGTSSSDDREDDSSEAEHP